MAGFLLFHPLNGLNPSYNAPNQRSNSAIYNPRPRAIGAISSQILSHKAATNRWAVHHSRKEIHMSFMKTSTFVAALALTTALPLAAQASGYERLTEEQRANS